MARNRRALAQRERREKERAAHESGVELPAPAEERRGRGRPPGTTNEAKRRGGRPRKSADEQTRVEWVASAVVEGLTATAGGDSGGAPSVEDEGVLPGAERARNPPQHYRPSPKKVLPHGKQVRDAVVLPPVVEDKGLPFDMPRLIVDSCGLEAMAAALPCPCCLGFTLKLGMLEKPKRDAGSCSDVVLWCTNPFCKPRLSTAPDGRGKAAASAINSSYVFSG
eukprot:jgi/Mesvir1/4141/Mv13053-RA.1